MYVFRVFMRKGPCDLDHTLFCSVLVCFLDVEADRAKRWAIRGWRAPMAVLAMSGVQCFPLWVVVCRWGGAQSLRVVGVLRCC